MEVKGSDTSAKRSYNPVKFLIQGKYASEWRELKTFSEEGNKNLSPEDLP